MFKTFKQFLNERASVSKKTELKETKELFNAVSFGVMDKIEELLKDQANPNITNSENKTPIFYAQSIKTIELLGEYNADFNHLDERGFPFFFYRGTPNTKETFYDYMDILLKYNTDILFQAKGYSFFEVANQALLFRYLTDKKIKNNRNKTPIEYRNNIGSFDIEVAEDMIKLGYTFDYPEMLSKTDIPYDVLEFVLQQHPKIEQSVFKKWIDTYSSLDENKIKLFLRYGYKIRKSYINSYSKRIPSKLLDRQTKIEAKDSNVIFEWIDDNDFEDIRKAHKEKILDFNIAHEEKETPLMYAISKKKQAIAEYLAENKVGINKAVEKRTPLVYAVRMKNYKVVEILISKKVNLNIVSDKYGSALHWASKANDIKMVELLVENGADVNIVASDYSPLDLTTSEEVSDYLESKGAKRVKN